MTASAVSAVSATPAPPTVRISAARPAPVFRGRIGRDARSGHYAAPRRYRLYLSTACPEGLRLAVAHSLLGLDRDCPATFLPAVPDGPDGGHSALRPLYEASAHHYAGPALAPVLADDWLGRIVSTHAPDILRDLDRRLGHGRPALCPEDEQTDIEAVERLCEQGIGGAAQRAGTAEADPAERAAALTELLDALGELERRLAGGGLTSGGRLTAADIAVWVSLVQLDTVHTHHLDADAVRRIATHPRLWAHARRLTAHPAFARHLDLDGIARRHRAHCRGQEAAGAGVRILDWSACASRQADRR